MRAASTAQAWYEFISHVILHFLPTRTIDSWIRGLTCLQKVSPSLAFADNCTALSDKQNLFLFPFFSFPQQTDFPFSCSCLQAAILSCAQGASTTNIHFYSDSSFSPCSVMKGCPWFSLNHDKGVPSAVILNQSIYGKSCITLGNYIPSLFPPHII